MDRELKSREGMVGSGVEEEVDVLGAVVEGEEVAVEEVGAEVVADPDIE